MGKHQDWSDVDWSMTSVEIAAIKGCAKSTVDSARHRLMPGSRGRHNSARVIRLRDDVWKVLDSVCTNVNKTHGDVLTPLILALRPFIYVNDGDRNV